MYVIHIRKEEDVTCGDVHLYVKKTLEMSSFGETLFSPRVKIFVHT